MTTPYGPNNSGPITSQNPNINSRALQVPDNSGSETFPTAHEVANFHRNADTNKRPEAIHHSLGTGHNQASFGDHIHDGSTGVQLLQATDLFNQNLGTPQGQKDAINQILNVLARLGAINSTNVSGSYPEIRTGLVTCTWTTAGLTSPSTPIVFSPAFSAIPRVVCTPFSTSTSAYSAKISAAVTTAGAAVMVMATASVGIGGTVDVHWIAINMKAYI
jgi:hypothetical protein